MLNAPGQLVYAFLKKIRFEVSIWLKQEYVHTAERYEAFSFLNETYGLFFFYFSIFNWVTEEFEFFLIREVKASLLKGLYTERFPLEKGR